MRERTDDSIERKRLAQKKRLLALGYLYSTMYCAKAPYLPILSPCHVNNFSLKCSSYLLASDGTLFDNGRVDFFRRHVQSQTFVSETHLLGKSGVGLPGGGMASVGLFHHLVDLFEGESLGFGLRGGMLAYKNLLRVRM